MENNLVVKANKLNESRYRLSVQEQRVILAMISMIDRDDMDFKTYSIRIQDFIKVVGLKGNSAYTDLKRVTSTLLRKSFTIKEATGDLQIGWVSSVKYYSDEGYFELSFDPKLKPYLIALKSQFTRYQLKNVIKMRSSYSVRIYELLKQYQSIGSRQFDLDELRSILAIPDGTLKLFANFKARVLEKAKSELKMTDIVFDYVPVKTGRRVTALTFTISSNDPVVEKSYKKKKTQKKIVEKQLEFDLDRYGEAETFKKLNVLGDEYPDLYKKLEKQAKNRLTKKEKGKPGVKLTILHKMADLLPGFLQRNKIKL